MKIVTRAAIVGNDRHTRAAGVVLAIASLLAPACATGADVADLACSDVLAVPRADGAPADTAIGVAVDGSADRTFVESELVAIVDAAVAGGSRLVVGTTDDDGGGGGTIVYDRDFRSTITAENDTVERRRRAAVATQLVERVDCLVDLLGLGSVDNPWPGVRSVAESIAHTGAGPSLVLVGPFVPDGREWDLTDGGDIETETARDWVAAMVAFDGGLGPIEGMTVQGIGVGRGVGDARHRLAVREVVGQIASEGGADRVDFAETWTGEVSS